MSNGAGCTIIAACTPANAPRSSSRILPPPLSSAGVPTHGDGEAERRRRRAPPRAPRRRRVAAIRLWPQAWPMSGSASYSAQMRDVQRAASRRARRTRSAGRRRRGSTRKPAASSSVGDPAAPRAPPRSRARDARGCGGSARPGRASRGRQALAGAASFASMVPRIAYRIARVKAASMTRRHVRRPAGHRRRRAQDGEPGGLLRLPGRARTATGSSSRTDRYGQPRLVIRDLDPRTGRPRPGARVPAARRARARARSPRSIPRPRSAASSTASASSTWTARASTRRCSTAR